MKKSDNRRFEEKFQDDLESGTLRAVAAGTWSFIVRVGNAFKLIWRGLGWFVEETKPAPKPQPKKKATRRKAK